MKLSINLKLLSLYIFTFILIYFPNLSYYIKINGIIIYIIFLSLYLIKNLLSKNTKFMNFFKDKTVFTFIILNILYTIYYAIRTSIAGTNIFDLYNLRIIQNMFPILILMGVIIIYCELDKLKFDKFKKYKFIINIATFQGFLCLLMIIFPSFRQVAYNIFYQGSSKINIYISASRLYGICDGNYTYAFQILHSILGLFSLCIAYFFKKPKLYINTLLIISVSILNGRTGILIFLFGFVLLLLYILISEKKIFKFLKYSFFIFLAISLTFIFIQKFLPSTAKIFEHAINDVLNFNNNSYNDTNETYQLISGIKLPNTFFNIIFGAGYRIYGGAGEKFGNYQTSDIGFVNDIFMVGIFSLLFLYNSYFIFMRKIFKSKDSVKFNKVFMFLLFVSIIFANFKGELFRSQMLISSLLIILLFIYKEVCNND